jgi:hypothetical protein
VRLEQVILKIHTIRLGFIQWLYLIWFVATVLASTLNNHSLFFAAHLLLLKEIWLLTSFKLSILSHGLRRQSITIIALKHCTVRQWWIKLLFFPAIVQYNGLRLVD